MGRWTLPHRDRRRRGEPHPVLDFLFTYYSLRPARLEQWHPGPGVRLLGDTSWFAEQPGYRPDGDGVVLDPSSLPGRIRDTAGFVHGLVRATASRPARLGCFGLHEWAMVYRTAQPRHGAVPLRLGPAGTDEVVESMSVACTHHDAFRFFTAAARPRNALQPTREDQVAMEQPGCLHATMDLVAGLRYTCDPGQASACSSVPPHLGRHGRRRTRCPSSTCRRREPRADARVGDRRDDRGERRLRSGQGSPPGV
ncbi:MAG: hypothetical protein OJJ54_24940 [Pseudonocardia sp.]|nr:hypothetical protein [Pseudonocardia sp.]